MALSQPIEHARSMKIESAIERNNLSSIPHIEFINRLIPSSVGQVAITEKWILPYQELILEDAREIRARVDRVLQKRVDIKEKLRAWNKQYPVGFCGEIRNEFFTQMKSEMLNPQRQGMKMVKNFVQAGGVVQPFWGIDSEMYFQNAIQLGDSILDVANDTVDRTKERVVHYSNLRDAPIKRIDSVEQFADVAEKYWDADCYPNIYLPWLAPIFPLLTIVPAARRHDKREALMLEIGVTDFKYANFYSLADDHLFGLSSDFISKGKYAEKRLPKRILDSLFSQESFVTRMQRIRPDIFRLTTDPHEALDMIRQYHFGPEDQKRGNKKLLKKYLAESNQIQGFGIRLESKSLTSGMP